MITEIKLREEHEKILSEYCKKNNAGMTIYVPHSKHFNGFRILVFFENKYGASIVRYGRRGVYHSKTDNEDQFQIAIIKKTNNDIQLVYNTPIMDDVVGRIYIEGVITTLDKIKEL